MVFIVTVIVVVTADGGPGQNIKTKWAVPVQPGCRRPSIGVYFDGRRNTL